VYTEVSVIMMEESHEPIRWMPGSAIGEWSDVVVRTAGVAV
jgi:hypothetical protein